MGSLSAAGLVGSPFGCMASSSAVRPTSCSTPRAGAFSASLSRAATRRLVSCRSRPRSRPRRRHRRRLRAHAARRRRLLPQAGRSFRSLSAPEIEQESVTGRHSHRHARRQHRRRRRARGRERRAPASRRRRSATLTSSRRRQPPDRWSPSHCAPRSGQLEAARQVLRRRRGRLRDQPRRLRRAAPRGPALPRSPPPCSFLVAVTSNYTWNRLWTFRDQRGAASAAQGMRFFIVSLGSLGANLLVLDAAHLARRGQVRRPGDRDRRSSRRSTSSATSSGRSGDHGMTLAFAALARRLFVVLALRACARARRCRAADDGRPRPSTTRTAISSRRRSRRPRTPPG